MTSLLVLLAAGLGTTVVDGEPYPDDVEHDVPRAVVPGILDAPARLVADGEVIDHGSAWGHAGPWVEDVDGDGLRDLIVGDFGGLFHFYRNTGTNRAPKYARAKPLMAGGIEAKVPIY